ncbi:MAG: hypothetical protein O3C45_04270 [Bacteroidetes bacterium]|nr:hypothetical protein [Bacteroidota bacterium]
MSVARIHEEALAYFLACVAHEPLLGREDARDLAADVVADFLPRLPEVDAPLRYVRTMCRHRLIGFLSRKRRREKWVTRWDVREVETVAAPVAEVSELGDREVRQLALISAHLRQADPLTRQILRWRVETDLSFVQMAFLVAGRPASLRMRTFRFAERVRCAWQEQDLSGEPPEGAWS